MKPSSPNSPSLWNRAELSTCSATDSNFFGQTFHLAYFAPASGMNPETAKLYEQNRFTVTRQVHFSLQHEQSIDVLLSLNGLPVATAELKNAFTGQTVTPSSFFAFTATPKYKTIEENRSRH